MKLIFKPSWYKGAYHIWRDEHLHELPWWKGWRPEEIETCEKVFKAGIRGRAVGVLINLGMRSEEELRDADPEQLTRALEHTPGCGHITWIQIMDYQCRLRNRDRAPRNH